MLKITKLKICDWSLMASSILILASSIQLEATGSAGRWPVWLHIALALVFLVLAVWHVYLHFGRSNWFARFSKLKSRPTRILWWLLLATVITGFIAMGHWFASIAHSTIGGVHGKIGFLMIIIAIGHTLKRRQFFRK